MNAVRNTTLEEVMSDHDDDDDENVELVQLRVAKIPADELEKVAREAAVVISKLAKATSPSNLAEDQYGRPVSLWGNAAVRRKADAWILKIAYERLGHNQNLAYAVLEDVSKKVRRHTGRSLVGIESESGPAAVAEVLRQIYGGTPEPL